MTSWRGDMNSFLNRQCCEQKTLLYSYGHMHHCARLQGVFRAVHKNNDITVMVLCPRLKAQK